MKPYVKTNKNDANDAEAICEAMSRPAMRGVEKGNDIQNGPGHCSEHFSHSMQLSDALKCRLLSRTAEVAEDLQVRRRPGAAVVPLLPAFSGEGGREKGKRGGSTR